MFDLFDFTPVEGDPFRNQAEPDHGSAPADVMSPEEAYQRNPYSSESWAHYAGNPEHPMAGRVGAAMVEEARRVGLGLKNSLQTFMGPMYGEGHVPQFNEATPEEASGYAGAGTNLASILGGPGPSGSALQAGWNPKALSYLEGLLKQKPPLQPETAAAVQQMINQGTEYATMLSGGIDVAGGGPNLPGAGYAKLAGTKHVMEQNAIDAAAAKAAKAKPTVPELKWAPLKEAAPETDYPTLAAVAKAWQKQEAAKKAPKPVKSTPLTPEQALGMGSGVTDAQVNKLFSTAVEPLKVPTMEKFNPNAGEFNKLAQETAPGTSGMKTPFNPDGLPMDQASVMQRMKDLGFGPIGGNWLFWRGIGEHGPYSWDSAAVGYKSPAGKTNEPGLFLAPDANAAGKPGKPIAGLYGNLVNAHVVRSENPLILDWKKATGVSGYSGDKMKKAINDAWVKGHDTLLLKNINDIGGKHDQMVVRNPNQLRHPHAVFNPKYKDLPNLLAAGGPGVELPPVVAQDQEMEEDKQ